MHDPELAHQLITTACQLGPLGINHGKSGNVSVRCDRDGQQGLLITPSGMAYERLGTSDLVWLSLQLNLPDEGLPRAASRSEGTAWADARQQHLVVGDAAPSSEWRFHLALYQHRADLAALVHTHAHHATLLSCTARVQAEGIPAFHYMIAMAGGDSLACAPYATFGTDELSVQVVRAMSGRKACLMAHHGMIAGGTDLAAALGLAVEVEALCALYAGLIGPQPVLTLSPAQMREVLARFEDYGR